MFSTFTARVRRAAAAFLNDGDHVPFVNPRGDFCVAQGLPPKAELARFGRWSVAIATGSAFQPVAAMPTTLANLVLHNGESGGGKTYIVDNVWGLAITSIAAATSLTLLAQLSHVGVAAPTDDTNQLITSTTGHGVYGGRAKRAVANTAFAIANKWTAIGESSGHPSTAIGAGVFSEVYGGFLVPPGGTFCINVVASTAGGTMIQGIEWYEVQL